MQYSVVSCPCFPSKRYVCWSAVTSRYYDSYLHKGIAIGLPWGCGGIVKKSPWECGAIGGWPWLICTEGLPLDYLGVAEGLSTDRLGNAERLADRRGIAFGLPLGLLVCLWDWRKMEIAKGLPTVCQWNTLGLCRDSLGISLGLPKICQGVSSGLTRDCLSCGPGFYRHSPDPELGS